MKRPSESLLEDQISSQKTHVLVVNADDLGKDEITTRRILKCFLRGRISSASAMVFMRDSERAADMAGQAGLDIGLHLNLTKAFTGIRNRPLLEKLQRDIAGFLAKRKGFFLYHPMLRRKFEYVWHAQLEEFQRLYGMEPSHVDGHEHAHLCANMILDRVIPASYPVRRSFHFFSYEKCAANRWLRRFLNGWVSRNYISTDYFFDLEPKLDDRLLQILALSTTSSVELMVHPEHRSQQRYLLSDRFHAFLKRVNSGTWRDVGTREEQEASGGNGRRRSIEGGVGGYQGAVS